MENDILKATVFTVAMLVLLYHLTLRFFYWLFQPKKCEVCGHNMEEYYNEETLEYEWTCPHCGHKIKY